MKQVNPLLIAFLVLSSISCQRSSIPKEQVHVQAKQPELAVLAKKDKNEILKIKTAVEGTAKDYTLTSFKINPVDENNVGILHEGVRDLYLSGSNWTKS